MDSVSEKMAHDIDKYIIDKRKEKRRAQRENGIYKDDVKKSYLSHAEIIRFSDGEAKCVLHDTTRGKDVYIITDIGNYGLTYHMYNFDNHMGPDEHYQDLKRCVSAIGGKARRITVMMPRLYSSRQDKRNARESLDCAMALQELERLGVHNILTFDAHNSKLQNAIPQCGFENLMPTFNMIKGLAEIAPDFADDPENMVVVSPDAGAMSRAIYYANVLEAEVGLFYKRRDYKKIVDGSNPIISHEYVGPDVKGKDALIVDDMIASGGTTFDLLEELKARGARNIYVCVTFALFTKGVEKFDEYYKKGSLTKVIATNLSYIPEEIVSKDWFYQVDMSRYIGKVINLLNYDRSISEFFDDTKKINQLLEEIEQG